MNYNYLRQNNIRFNKLSTLNLWICEISGQLSDGKWENYKPAEVWWPMKAEYDPELAENESHIRNGWFSYGRAVNVVSKELIDHLWFRMLGYIVFGMHGVRVDDRTDSIVDDIMIQARNGMPFEEMRKHLEEHGAKRTWYKLGEFDNEVDGEKLRVIYTDILEKLAAGENACKKIVRGELKNIHAAMKNIKRA